MRTKKKSIFTAISFFLFSITLSGLIEVKNVSACGSDDDCGGADKYGKCLPSGFCGCTDTSRGNCDKDFTNGCEVDLKTDVSHCGSCSIVCKSGQTCENGYCKGTAATSYCSNVTCGANSYCSFNSCYCNTGYKDCNGDKSSGASGNGCEVHSYEDENNCGLCGRKCSAGYYCSSGSCKKGTGTTGGTTTDPKTQTSKCPEFICGPNTYCSEGQCMCSAGTKNCDGTWANGCECGRSYTSCQNNACGCQPNFYDCDGNAYNGCESPTLCAVCKTAELRNCTTSSNCSGKQICGTNGQWGNCVMVTEKVCTPYSTIKCSPSMDGQKCTTLGGISRCNSCGTGYGACGAPSDTVCCPGTKTSCFIGQCTGTKTCSDDGKDGGTCISDDGTTCCAVDTDCNDFNGCTTEKCINSRCEYTPLEDCRGLTPVKCKTSSNCASKDSCVNGSCLSLQCNEEFIIEDHKCVCTGNECGGECYFSGGVCCGEFWNDDFFSCTYDFSYYEERVNLSLDQEAKSMLSEAKSVSANGDLRKGSVLAKIAVAMAEIKLSTREDVLKNQATAFVNEAKDLLSRGNYALAIDKVDESLSLLSSGKVQTTIEEPSLWDKNKIPIVAFSFVIVVLSVFIFYILIIPKI